MLAMVQQEQIDVWGLIDHSASRPDGRKVVKEVWHTSSLWNPQGRGLGLIGTANPRSAADADHRISAAASDLSVVAVEFSGPMFAAAIVDDRNIWDSLARKASTTGSGA